jgi:hypothetical protein
MLSSAASLVLAAILPQQADPASCTRGGKCQNNLNAVWRWGVSQSNGGNAVLRSEGSLWPAAAPLFVDGISS